MGEQQLEKEKEEGDLVPLLIVPALIMAAYQAYVGAWTELWREDVPGAHCSGGHACLSLGWCKRVSLAHCLP